MGEATCTILVTNGSGYENVSEKEMLLKNYNIKADVIKLGHHDSNSSTTQGFLDKVNPKYSDISVGKDNSYGHPHKESMNRLKAKNIPVYRTDEYGTIIATSNGKDITFNVKLGSYTYNGIATSTTSTPSNTDVPKATTETRPNSSSNDTNKTVYFTLSGKSYHYDKNCSTLKRSKTILEATQQEAISSGHADSCNVCAGGN